MHPDRILHKYKISKFGKFHKLSGIALLVEGKILLVLASKYTGQNNKWSIPKGHVESRESLTSALEELREETGIVLDRDCDEMIEFNYKKGGRDKYMEVFVYYRDKEEFTEYLDGWKIKQSFLNPSEIIEAKFFDLTEASKIMDIAMVDLLTKFD